MSTPKLNQIIAVANGVKTRAHQAITSIYQKFQKADLMEGFNRTYVPNDAETGEKLPPESKLVQVVVSDMIAEAIGSYTELFNVVATQEFANTAAKADVIVDGKKVLEAVPVTYLLFLEKQLVDIHTFVDKLPILDPAYKWTFDTNVNQYVSEGHVQNRNKKIMRNHTLAKATDKHPEQVQTYNEEVCIGQYHTKKFSGAVPAKDKNDSIVRVRKLQEAVKMAREYANNSEAALQKVASPVLEYIFNKK